MFGTLQFDPTSGQASASPAPVAFDGAGALGPGQVLGGRFTIQKELGRGAMGVVWLATDPERGEVAIKVVQGPATDEVQGRFEREIAVSKRAVHPNVIEVFDAGTLPDGSSYMSMEVLGGQSMQGLILRDGPQSVERSLALIEQTLEGLQAVHEAGIVHRDLKPENIQILDGDRVKIVDFGVSRFLDDDSPEAENMFQTVKGQLSGTPQYVAPEAVLEPDTIQTSHDVYACGVSLYELLAGVLPFPPARNLRDMLSNTVNARAIPLDESNPAGAPFDPALERFVRRMLEKDPEARPNDAKAALELLRETRDSLGGKSPSSGSGDGFTRRLLRGITGLFKKQ
ncbi:MAG: serine/threonine protein kinase [Planctomycetes bacterium]|nr:serine/threonine protein kinase [Planctomycetota bacterium]